MTRSRYVGHLCGDYYRKPNDDVFEYCKCGARFFLDRYRRPVDIFNSRLEEDDEL
tara:strand:+ start:400 stop:564 length:165 start_codon:yes stop_codon:yes gene_type:complete